ncbi:MAG: DNA-binding response regulator [Flavobacterium psychrophilum]|nr:MAG: DNA-binding response regulator [Flavobacterium psychrophilum]
MKINCIVIDDEPLALELMETYVRRVPYLELKGLFHKPFNAFEILHTGTIHLMYLDINMPDITGVDFLKGITSPPKVIFITAYDNYAVQGFELNAVDYLLKPVPFNRFMIATDRAYELLSKKETETSIQDYILVKAEHHTIKIKLNAIYYIEGYKDYLKIYTDDTTPILTITTLKAIEELLPTGFIRIHRSYIVSIDKITSFRNSKVRIKDKYIPIGDSYNDIFYQSVVHGKIK